MVERTSDTKSFGNEPGFRKTNEQGPSFRSVAGWKSFFLELAKGFAAHDHMTMAAALAFYTALSLAPFLLIVLAVVSLLGQSSQNQLFQQMDSLMGPQAAQSLRGIVESSDNHPEMGSIAGLIGILTLLFSASGIFAQMQASLNIIFEAQSQAASGVWGWIRKRILSMGMVVTFGFIAMVSMVTSTVLAFFFPTEGQFWHLLNMAVSLLIFGAMFAVTFRILPDTHLPWKEAFKGGVATAVLFTIGKTLIGLYLGKSAVGSAYGAAGSLIVLLVWVYYSSIIVFVGAETTRILAAREVSPERLKVNAPKTARKYETSLSPG